MERPRADRAGAERLAVVEVRRRRVEVLRRRLGRRRRRAPAPGRRCARRRGPGSGCGADHGELLSFVVQWLRQPTAGTAAAKPGQHPSALGATLVFVALRSGTVPVARRAGAAYVRRMSHRAAVAASPSPWRASPAGRLRSAAASGSAASPTPTPRVLTLLDPFGTRRRSPPFADEVSRLSEGALRIRVVHGRARAAPTTRRPRSGDVQRRPRRPGRRRHAGRGTSSAPPACARSAHRSWSTATRSRSASSPATSSRRCSQELRPLGPGGHRRSCPARCDARSDRTGALAAPGDFQGLTIGTQQSNVADATLRALGARPRRLPVDVHRRARGSTASSARSARRDRPPRRGRART